MLKNWDVCVAEATVAEEDGEEDEAPCCGEELVLNVPADWDADVTEVIGRVVRMTSVVGIKTVVGVGRPNMPIAGTREVTVAVSTIVMVATWELWPDRLSAFPASIKLSLIIYPGPLGDKRRLAWPTRTAGRLGDESMNKGYLKTPHAQAVNCAKKKKVGASAACFKSQGKKENGQVCTIKDKQSKSTRLS